MSKDIVTDNSWKALRAHTKARIAIGRAGGSITTDELLKFRYDHARARDAVHIPLNITYMKQALEKISRNVLIISSEAETRDIYLKRPDLGRRLSRASRQLLAREGHGKGYDIAIAVADGLSAVAVERNARPFLEKFFPDAEKQGLSIAPLTIIEQGRVAAGDEVAQLFNATMAVILIGERPGLSSPDSMGCYMTYRPERGTTDEKRNCISNIRDEGFLPQAASDKLLYLVQASLTRKISGVALKDMQTEQAAIEAQGKLQ